MIKVFETFAGIGAQHKALSNLKEEKGIDFEMIGTSEWYTQAIIGYDSIHHGLQDTFIDDDGTTYEDLTHETMLEYFADQVLSSDSKDPIFFKQIKRFKEEKLKSLYIAMKRNKNYGSVVGLDGEHIKDKIDLLTYSFPCFTAGHMITVKVDKKTTKKKIEDIQSGDLVLTHTNKFQKVVKPMSQMADSIYIINIEGVFKNLEATEEHPFYIRNQETKQLEWVKVKDLNFNIHKPLRFSNSTLMETRFNSIEKISKDVMVYNMEVEEDESYVVEGIIVHNCTDISNAGKGEGMVNGKRSGLLWEIKRILTELKDLPNVDPDGNEIEGNRLPRFLVMENVKMILSPKHRPGWDFFQDFLASLGYKNTLMKINSLEVGIPQSRDRVFCVSELYADKDSDFVQIQDQSNYSSRVYNGDLSKFLNLDNEDYVEEHIEEYKKMIPNDTPSRREILDQSKKLNHMDKCFTITTKADRKPNQGIFLCDKDGKLLNNFTNRVGKFNYTDGTSIELSEYLDNSETPWITTTPETLPSSSVVNDGVRGRPTTLPRNIPLSHPNPNGKDKSTFRYMTARECLKLMGFQEDQRKSDYDAMIDIGLTHSEIQVFAGNSIVVQKLEYIFKEILERFETPIPISTIINKMKEHEITFDTFKEDEELKELEMKEDFKKHQDALDEARNSEVEVEVIVPASCWNNGEVIIDPENDDDDGLFCDELYVSLSE